MSRFELNSFQRAVAFRGLLFAGLFPMALFSNAAGAQARNSDCLIEPHAVTKLETRELGALEEMLVDRGDLVKAGQPVARLESGVEEISVQLMRARAHMDAELEETSVRAEFAARRLERTSQLLAQNSVSSFEHDQAVTEAAETRLRHRQALQRSKVAQLELDGAKKQLDLRTLRSPIDGVVVKRLLQVGESVENRPIMQIAATDPLNVEIIMTVDEFGTVEVGEVAQVSPQFPGAVPVPARVTVVDGLIDAASGTFGVRLELPNPEHRIPGGVGCEVVFGTSHAAVLPNTPDEPMQASETSPSSPR